MSKLLKKGKVFAYQNKWMEQQNDYSLSYLTMEGFIKDVYDNMIKAIPNAHKYKLSYHLVSVSQQPLKIYHSSYDNQNI